MRFVKKLAVPFLAATLAASVVPVSSAAPLPHPHKLALSPCTIAAVPGPAQCGRYTVYENRASRRGRTLSLNVIVLPARGAHPAADPVFFLTGGPGEGASEDASLLDAPTWKAIRRDHAIVLVDQRGTGRSGALTCDTGSANAAMEELYAVRISASILKACLAGFAAHADVRQYTTPIAMDDLDDVRAALGYDKIDLYGASYGTRAALVYMRRHGDHVRAAILRAIAPVDMKALLPSARDSQRAFDGLVTDCGADPACAAAYPHIRADLAAVLARLDRSAVHVVARDPVRGKPADIVVTRPVFVGALTWMMSTPEGAGAVPQLLKVTAHGDFKPFVSAAMPLAVAAGSHWGIGMALTIICSEDAAQIDPHAIAAAVKGTFAGAARVRNELQLCKRWPRGVLPAGYSTPVRTDLPVLMISGQYDPIDGIELARRVAGHLPNSLHVVAPHVAHHPQFPGCTKALVTRFLEQGSAKRLDASCVQSVTRPAWAGVAAK